RAGGARTVALVNDADSPVAADADALLPLYAGEERSVAATKSMIASLVAGVALVADWAKDADLAAALKRLPPILEAESDRPLEPSIKALITAKSMFVIG